VLALVAGVSAACSHDLWLDSGPVPDDGISSCVETIVDGLQVAASGGFSLSGAPDGFLLTAVVGEDSGFPGCRGLAVVALDESGRPTSGCRGLFDVAADGFGASVVALSTGGAAAAWPGSDDDSRGLWIRVASATGEALPEARVAGSGSGSRDCALVEDGTGALVTAWREYSGEGGSLATLLVRRLSAADGTPIGGGPVTVPGAGSWWPAALGRVGGGFAAAWIPWEGTVVQVVRLASDLSVAAAIDIPIPPGDRAMGIPALAARDERLAVAWIQTREDVGHHAEIALVDGADVVARTRFDRPTPPPTSHLSGVAVQWLGRFGWAVLWSTTSGPDLFARFTDEDLSPIGEPRALFAEPTCGTVGLNMSWNGQALAIGCWSGDGVHVATWACRPPGP
jgi:hypothetical protein